jgi:hypothetical protein
VITKAIFIYKLPNVALWDLKRVKGTEILFFWGEKKKWQSMPFSICMRTYFMIKTF